MTVATAYTILFVFTWILSTIVAVNWCYIFKLSFPQYSEDLLGWACYTCLIIPSVPYLKLRLLRQVPSRNARTKEVWRLLLISMTGTLVGTSCSGLVSMAFPHFSELDRPGPLGLALAAVASGIVIIFHASAERALRHASCPDNTCWAVSADILLNSLWSTMGFFWNAVWNRGIARMRHRSQTGQRVHNSSQGPRHTFRTFQDDMNGRPSDLDGGPGYSGLLAKAAITLFIGLVALCVLPEVPPLEAGRHWKRRLLLSVNMMMIIIPSYAVTDAGYYFGTAFVANKVGSSSLGLFVAFLYAVFLSCFVAGIAASISWKPKSRIGERYLQLACWLVSYAWWYPWQEVLYQVQGYGLWRLNMDTYMEDALKLAISVAGAALSTVLLAWTFRRCLSFQFSFGASRSTPTHSDESCRLADETRRDSTLRFFAEIAGLHTDESLAPDGVEMAD